jgi:hypothetical protein
MKMKMQEQEYINLTHGNVYDRIFYISIENTEFFVKVYDDTLRRIRNLEITPIDVIKQFEKTTGVKLTKYKDIHLGIGYNFNTGEYDKEILRCEIKGIIIDFKEDDYEFVILMPSNLKDRLKNKNNYYPLIEQYCREGEVFTYYAEQIKYFQNKKE